MNNQGGGKPKNRTGIYVTLLVILMTIALVAAIAGAVARSVRGNEGVTTEGTVTKKDDGAVTRQDDTVETDDAFVTAEDTTAGDAMGKETNASDTTGEKKAEAIPKFVNPTGGTLMKGYSTDVPVFSLTMDDYRTHNGIDISAAQGTDVMAAADGVINEVWDDPMMGKCVSISHSGGAVSTYKNLNSDLAENIEKGLNITAGSVIGTVGETALEEIAEESHLHFELAVNAVQVDPTEYIDFSAAAVNFEE